MIHVVRSKEGSQRTKNIIFPDAIPVSLADDGVYIQILSPSWPVSVGNSAGRPLSTPRIGVIVAPFSIWGTITCPGAGNCGRVDIGMGSGSGVGVGSSGGNNPFLIPFPFPIMVIGFKAVGAGIAFIHSSPGASHSAELSNVAKSKGNSADVTKMSVLKSQE